MTNRHKLIAGLGLAVLAALAAVALAAPSGAQTDAQPINTRVKLLEHKVKNLEARIATLTAPEAGQCTRGPNHLTLNVYDHEDGHRTAALFSTYLLDCGPHGVTRQHDGPARSRTDKTCHDLDGMTAGSTDPVPAAWATWWASLTASGVDDACTTVAADAAAINANGTTLSDASKLLLRHTDAVLGWEAFHAAQHPALPTG